MRLYSIRQVVYDLRENLLFRPGLVAAAAGLAALILPLWEARGGAVPLAVATWLPLEPGTAQILLGTIAGAMMTVVSVVYSILLVALSLASMQFSTRVLATFMRDRASQSALGMLVGTFVYALLVLGRVHTDPPFVPVVSTLGALGLALTSLAALVWFIHHIVRSIQANHLVDAIAVETERVIDAVFGEPVGPGVTVEPASRPSPPLGATPVLATVSGYVQLVATDMLLAEAAGGHLFVVRGMGQFVAEGAPIAWWSGDRSLDHRAVNAAFDLGPTRTMQDDVEWGFRQIVDVGLKAISPAVNDPSTGATCVDHLGRLCVRAAGRQTPQGRFERGGATVDLPAPSFSNLVRLSFQQLRQYGRSDMAMLLRILRALGDVAEVTADPAGRAEILMQGRLAWEAGRLAFPNESGELDGRWERLQRLCGVEVAGG